MRKIIIVLLFLFPLFSFKQTATLESSCNPCSPNELITFTGSGYTEGRNIAVDVTKPNGGTFQFNGGIVDNNGNILFSASFIEVGDYLIKVFEIKGRTHWIYKSEINISIQ